MAWLPGVLALLALAAAASASSGDTSLEFQRCLRTCQATGCTAAPSAQAAGQHHHQQQQQQCSLLCPQGNSDAWTGRHMAAPLALRLWRWDCHADCRYLCMWEREERKAAAAAPRAPPEKYFGKWPFTRALGMQEPASVAFSLLNLAAQLRCLQCYLRLLRRAKGTSNTAAATGSKASAAAAARDRAAAWACRWLWVVHFALAALAWLASSVFHGRDTWATERFDYYAAGASVAFNLFLTAVRTLRINKPRGRLLLGAAILGAYVRHIYHMQFTLFDYGLHVGLCIAAGLVQAALWLYWAAAAAPRNHRGRRCLLAFMVLIYASMALEVFDFPPLGAVLDAHALWHLATGPLAYLWYCFVAADMAGSGSGAQPPRQNSS